MNEVLAAAEQAVEANARHSAESLRELLWKWFPQEPDSVIDAAVEAALYGG